MKKFDSQRVFHAVFGMLCLMQGQTMFSRLLTASIRNRPILTQLSQTETSLLMFFSLVIWIGGFLFIINKKIGVAGFLIGVPTFILGVLQWTDGYVADTDPFYFTDAMQNMAIGTTALYSGLNRIKRKDPDTIVRPV